jgi:hypothetical protein
LSSHSLTLGGAFVVSGITNEYMHGPSQCKIFVYFSFDDLHTRRLL